MDDQLVFLQELSVFIEVVGFQLNGIVGKAPAPIAKTNDPDWFRGGDVRAELDVADLDILLRIRPVEEINETAAVPADCNDDNDGNKDSASRHSPLARSQKLE